MKKFSVLFVSLVCIIFANKITAQSFSFSNSESLHTKYVTPTGIVTYRDPVLQGSFTLTHKTGLFADLWYSLGSDLKWSKDWDDEVDLSFGWSGKILNMNIFSIVSYFDNFKVFNYGKNDVIKSYIKMELPSHFNSWLDGAIFVSYLNNAIVSKKTPFRGGNFWELGVSSVCTLDKVISFSPRISGGYDDGTFGVKSGTLVKYSGAVCWKISDNLNWNIIEATYYDPLGRRCMNNQLVVCTRIEWNVQDVF